MKPKILTFDIEISSTLIEAWTLWDARALKVVRPWYVMCFAYKWNDGKTKVVTIDDLAGTDDYSVTKAMWDLFDEADIVIAHNGDRFDIKKMNAKFAEHGMGPPSLYKSIDTLKIARKKFGFLSNKLDDLGTSLRLGNKVTHTGYKLWSDCMAGDKKAWRLMKKYVKQDVDLLYSLYEELLPWIDHHPNIALYSQKPDACPKCGEVGYLRKRGIRTTQSGSKQQWRCDKCKGFSRSRLNKTNVLKPERIN